MTNRLNNDEFLTVIAHTPLVSIDLVLRNAAGAMLMGCRLNQPAKGTWFVPGGRIYKDETLEVAFARICKDELGIERDINDARLLGAFTHKYDTNAFEAPNITTHYVVLAYDLGVQEHPLDAAAQHSATRWISEEDANTDPLTTVHDNILPYFKALKKGVDGTQNSASL